MTAAQIVMFSATYAETAAVAWLKLTKELSDNGESLSPQEAFMFGFNRGACFGLETQKKSEESTHAAR